MSEELEAECVYPATLENPLLGINRFSSQSHVAQQSRRDKMRINQNYTSPHSGSHANLSQFPNQMLHLSEDHAMINSELAEVRIPKNCDLFKSYTGTGSLVALYDPTMFPSEMLNFSTGTTDVLSSQKDSTSLPDSSCFAAAAAKTSDSQDPCNWKGFNSRQNCGFIVKCLHGSGNTSPYCNQNPMLPPMIAGGILPRALKDGNLSTSQHYFMNPICNSYQDVQSSANNPSSEISSQDSQKQYTEATHSFSPFRHNSLSEVVATTSVGSQEIDMGLVRQSISETVHGSWGDGSNELVLLPSYGNQSTAHRFDNVVGLMNRPVEANLELNQEAFVLEKNADDFRTDHRFITNGLSLSLSSNPYPPSDLHLSQLEDRYQSQELASHGAYDLRAKLEDLVKRQCGCTNNVGHFPSYPRSAVGAKRSTNIAGSSLDSQRNAGPLGPFTGYATILKSSKFLKPAQLLLDEFCKVSQGLQLQYSDIKVGKEQVLSERGSDDASASCETVKGRTETRKPDGNSCLSSSSFYVSSGPRSQFGLGSGECQGYRPEFQRKKAKLLYMLDEVFRQYRQYHHQLQTVISSFESVAGLSSATPYTSLALKAVSKHFRCLKNAISDQLRGISKALGEECSSSGPSKGETPKLKFIDQSFRKQKSVENLGMFEQQQHVWRPQRGLPERSVAVLRAWLFEHFLHPYPNDGDKQMLATRTGLSRSQVSNWFINARVRLWKPMVEEIHMLETKQLPEMGLNSVKNDRKPTGEERPAKNLSVVVPNSTDPAATEEMASTLDDRNGEQQLRHKRMRMENCHIPAMLNGSMGFGSCQSGLEMGGLGSVSLTLGLRHSAESVQQQHQQQKQHISSQFLHDFVG